MSRIKQEKFHMSLVCIGCIGRNFVVKLTSNLKTSLGVVMNATFIIKHSKSKDMQEKESNMSVWCGQKIPSLRITV